MKTTPVAPELILYNARIYTVDSDYPWAEAVAIRAGKYIAIGDSQEVLSLASSETNEIDLQGRLVLPGFCDAHIHFYYWSLGLSEVNLAGATSKSEMLEMIRQRAAESSDDAWITGRGWNESWWGDTEYPTAQDIDSVTASHQKAIFWRTDMHAAVVNSNALNAANIDETTSDPYGGVIEHDQQGQPTGILKDLAISLVDDIVPQPTSSDAQEALLRGNSSLHRIGVTAVHDQRMKGHNEGIHALAAYQRLYRKDKLKLRVNCNVAAHHMQHASGLGLSYGFGNDKLRLGHVKLFADGSLGSQTCLLSEPFEKVSETEQDNYGVRLTELEEIADILQESAALGFPVSIHAIGDRANKEVLDILEELQQRGASVAAPHRIEHVQMLQPQDIARLGEANISASVQPVHIIDDIAIADRLLGDRSSNLYRFNSLLKADTLLAFGSDAPVADPNPFLGIHAALYRQQPERMEQGAWHGEEAITLEDAVYAYTMGAARAANWHYDIGSITVGKCADAIVLDRDLFQIVEEGVHGDEVAATQVIMTLFDGKIVHSNLE